MLSSMLWTRRQTTKAQCHLYWRKTHSSSSGDSEEEEITLKMPLTEGKMSAPSEGKSKNNWKWELTTRQLTPMNLLNWLMSFWIFVEQETLKNTSCSSSYWRREPWIGVKGWRNILSIRRGETSDMLLCILHCTPKENQVGGKLGFIRQEKNEIFLFYI